MRNIKLIADKPFFNNCDIAVVDVTNGAEKQRCKITVEYAKYDVELLKEKGLDRDETLAHYKDWIYHTVKRYIGDDWDWVNGEKEIMEMIDAQIKRYF